jgi:microcystin-dependent protein
MGLSRLEYPYTGGDQVFAVNFALGYLDTDDVTAFVVGEFDGLGDQVTRAYTWDDAGFIRLTADLPNPCTVTLAREVSKDQLILDVAGTSAFTRATLVNGFKQLMMSMHEQLDATDVASGSADRALLSEGAASVSATASADSATEAAASATEAANTDIGTAIVDAATAQTAADAAQASADAAQESAERLPDLAGSGLSFVRVNTEETTTEFRTPAEVITDLGVAPAVEGVRTGSVHYFLMSSAPSGYLKLNGATISRTTYAALFAAIGTVGGGGDGSTTFDLPDLRGEFVRGWDDGRGVDGSRAFGSAQADELEAHNHIGGLKFYTSLETAYGAATTDNGVISSLAGGGYTRKLALTSTTGGTETRPRNVALLACIKV